MSKRIERANQLIKKELSQIILKEIEFPSGVLVTLTRVESAPNLKNTSVFISILPEKMSLKILELLNRRIYELQGLLNKRLKMRPLPRICFLEEKETRKAGRVEEILEAIRKGKC
jgi:ribosome-binding factor A